MSLVARFKQAARKSVVFRSAARAVRHRKRAKIHAPSGFLEIGSANLTFVMVCGGEFDQSIPNAATMCRMGWCRGFEALGVPYVLVRAQELQRVLPSLPNPICWVAGSDYEYLSDADLALLKRYPHGVLVSTGFAGEQQYFESRGFPNVSWAPSLRMRILKSEPTFLFTMSSESRFHYYDWWTRSGARLVSLPLACDATLYMHPRADVNFSSVEAAFVGGYWPYKAIQFDRFLRPLANHLHVYGYSRWPYGHFGGQLDELREPALYRQARLSPVINEPHVCEMSVDINERVFKVMGSGGLAICDPTEGYREWFSEDELLLPANEGEYWDMVWSAIKEPGAFQGYRAAGRSAVLDRHTYMHRAEKFAAQLGLDDLPTPADRILGVLMKRHSTGPGSFN